MEVWRGGGFFDAATFVKGEACLAFGKGPKNNRGSVMTDWEKNGKKTPRLSRPGQEFDNAKGKRFRSIGFVKKVRSGKGRVTGNRK